MESACIRNTNTAVQMILNFGISQFLNEDFANFEAFLHVVMAVYSISTEQVVTSEGFVVCHSPSVFL